MGSRVTRTVERIIYYATVRTRLLTMVVFQTSTLSVAATSALFALPRGPVWVPPAVLPQCCRSAAFYSLAANDERGLIIMLLATNGSKLCPFGRSNAEVSALE